MEPVSMVINNSSSRWFGHVDHATTLTGSNVIQQKMLMYRTPQKDMAGWC